MFSLLVFLACGRGADSPPPAVLTLAGSSTIQPLAEVAAEAWSRTQSDVVVDVQGGGSSVGISTARSGLADIGMASRALKPEEADLVGTTIAHDGIALVVHATNPLTGLSHDQVVGIYSGAVTSWAALGGEDHPITVVNKEEGRSTREMFQEHFRVSFVASAVIIGPNGQAITTVAGNPWAVAYVSIGSAHAAEAEGSPVKRLALDGVDATAANVANGSYPLRRALSLVTAGAPEGQAKAFIDFVLSPEGQALVAAQDFVPVRDAASAR